MNVCLVCFCKRGYKTNDIIESSKNVITKNVYNYVDCKLPSLITEPCQDYSCDNFFHYLCQNDDDTETFADKFDYRYMIWRNVVKHVLISWWNHLIIVLKYHPIKKLKNHLIKKFIVLFKITTNQKIFVIVMQLLLTTMIIMKWLMTMNMSMKLFYRKINL